MIHSRRLSTALIISMFIALTATLALAGGPVQISDLRVSSTDTTSRLVLELTDATNFSINRLKNPDRLYIDIHDSSVKAKKYFKINNPLLKNVRYAQFDDRTVRVVMEMSPGYTYKVFRLSGPARIVVDFFSSSKSVKRSKPSPRTTQVKKHVGPVTNASEAMAMTRWKLQEVEKKKAQIRANMRAQQAARNKAQTKSVAKITPTAKPKKAKPTISVKTEKAPIKKSVATNKRSVASTKRTIKKNTSAAVVATAVTSTVSSKKKTAPKTSSVGLNFKQTEDPKRSKARKLAEARAKALKKSADTKTVIKKKYNSPTIVVEKPTRKNRSASRKRGKFKRYRVVIDAGHGGRDPGAIGIGGLKEKTVVLDIAKRLKRKLENMGGYEVILTRSTDKFLELEDRTKFANRRKADLFVSIHANASRNKRTRGLETYYLNRNGDGDTIKIAARENSIPVEEMQKAVDKTNTDYLLASLTTQHKQEEAGILASTVLKRMFVAIAKRYHGVTKRPSKMGPFYVLYGARMPAVLVEVSYITNKTEASRLKTSTYRDYLAAGIAAGIKDYIKESGRRGDLLANR